MITGHTPYAAVKEWIKAHPQELRAYEISTVNCNELQDVISMLGKAIAKTDQSSNRLLRKCRYLKLIAQKVKSNDNHLSRLKLFERYLCSGYLNLGKDYFKYCRLEKNTLIISKLTAQLIKEFVCSGFPIQAYAIQLEGSKENFPGSIFKKIGKYFPDPKDYQMGKKTFKKIEVNASQVLLEICQKPYAFSTNGRHIIPIISCPELESWYRTTHHLPRFALESDPPAMQYLKALENKNQDIHQLNCAQEVVKFFCNRLQDFWEFLNELPENEIFLRNKFQCLRLSQEDFPLTEESIQRISTTDCHYLSLHSTCNFAKSSFLAACKFAKSHEIPLSFAAFQTSGSESIWEKMANVSPALQAPFKDFLLTNNDDLLIEFLNTKDYPSASISLLNESLSLLLSCEEDEVEEKIKNRLLTWSYPLNRPLAEKLNLMQDLFDTWEKYPKIEIKDERGKILLRCKITSTERSQYLPNHFRYNISVSKSKFEGLALLKGVPMNELNIESAQNLNGLDGCDIKKLVLSCKISNCNYFFGTIESLEELHIRTGIGDEHLNNLPPHLKVLKIGSNFMADDMITEKGLAKLAHLSCLEELQIVHTYMGYWKIKTLKGLPLKKLSLIRCYGIDNLEPLKKTAALTHVSLQNSSSCGHPLRNLVEHPIQKLDLNGTTEDDNSVSEPYSDAIVGGWFFTGPLLEMKNLKSLDIRKSALTPWAIKQLSELECLQKIYLHPDQLSESVEKTLNHKRITYQATPRNQTDTSVNLLSIIAAISIVVIVVIISGKTKA